MNKTGNKAHKPDQEHSANFNPLKFGLLKTMEDSKQPWLDAGHCPHGYHHWNTEKKPNKKTV